MKIKIITIHNIHNYGSIFQAMALNQYILNMGYECEIINYNPVYFTKGTLRSRIGKILNYFSYRSEHKKYVNFIKKNMKVTKNNYTNLKELEKISDNADLFISGGDQLWNEFYHCGRDDSYKLVFTKKNKLAFGTSLGKREFTKKGLEDLAIKVSDYKGYGIRESSGVKLLLKAGLDNVKHVCDPIFLLEKEAYKKYISSNSIKERYMFVYLVQSSSLLEKVVDKISKELNLKVVLCAGYVPKCHYDILIKDLGPDETLSYIVNSDFVLSASFHATAFATYFNKSFATLLPGEDTNARIEDFLEFVGLSNRIIKNEEDLLKILKKNTDWSRTNHILENYIEDSKKFLELEIEKIQKNIVKE